MVWKYGNSNAPYSTGGFESFDPVTHQPDSDLALSSERSWTGKYGEYPTALNALAAGRDAEVSYTFQHTLYPGPFTYEELIPAGDGGDPRAIVGNYGHHPVTMTSYDNGMYLEDGTQLSVHLDYEFSSITFPLVPTAYHYEAYGLTADGVVDPSYTGSPRLAYVLDGTSENAPDITVQVLRGGAWSDYARASWSDEGAFSVTDLETGAVSSDPRIALPSGIDNVRTAVTTASASLDFFTRVGISLKGAGAFHAEAERLFSESNLPSMNAFNRVGYEVESDAGARIAGGTTDSFGRPNQGYNVLSGYAPEQSVAAAKTGTVSQTDADILAQRATVSFSATVDKMSFAPDIRSYEEGLADGTLAGEYAGTWYDLLPEGMVPDLATIRLRSADSIQRAYTVENYKGTGRTLLVVQALLTPQPEEYEPGEGLDTLVRDTLRIDFDAKVNLRDLPYLGATAHNVIAYESANEGLGTLQGQSGEPDDPRAGRHERTADAFADAQGNPNAAELDAMTNLDPERDDPAFVYAGARVPLTALQTGQSQLIKDVMVNRDGWWSSGITRDDPALARNVYVGDEYAYRIGTLLTPDSTISDLIFYDVLESYAPAGDDDPADVGSPRWKGVLTGVDTSYLESLGIAPVVYVTTKANPQVGVTEGEGGFSLGPDSDLSDQSVWQPLGPETDLSAVTAVAVDAQRTTSGQPYESASGQALYWIASMKAPSGPDAQDLVGQGAHAYNNVYRFATTHTGRATETGLTRFDYTKVGLVNNSLDVRKTWADDNDRDGVRPTSVTVRLLADGLPVEDAGIGVSAEQATATLSEANEWHARFEALPYKRADGSKIVYAVVEDEVAHYRPSYAYGDHRVDIENTLDYETTSVSGAKTWAGDSLSVRPKSITVRLLADGAVVSAQVVRPDLSGNWRYSLEGLPKNRDGGTPIHYTVEEVASSAPDYDATVSGSDILNTYHVTDSLTIGKSGQNFIDAVRDTRFSFRVQLFPKGTVLGGATAPTELIGPFAYDIVDAQSGAVLSSGSMGSGAIIGITAGQRIVVKGLPKGAVYRVEELPTSGFSTVGSAVSTGTIATTDDPNSAKPRNTVEYVNSYDAKAQVSIPATKNMAGAAMRFGQFLFDVRDEEGSLLGTFANGVPTDTSTEGAISSTAPVTLGPIELGAKYLGTHSLTISERGFANDSVRYDDAAYTAKIEVSAQEGTGELVANVLEVRDSSGALVNTQTGVVFDNAYASRGEYQLQLRKRGAGGLVVAESQFAFEVGLVTVSADGTTSTYEPLQTARNDANGIITFEPFEFTERDDGAHYFYAFHELADPNDQNIDYDEHWGLLRVDATDMHNGTMQVTGRFATDDEGVYPVSVPCFECGGTGEVDGEACPICGADGTLEGTSGGAYFVNRSKPGALDVTKLIAPGTAVNDRFSFRVTFEDPYDRDVDLSGVEVTAGPAPAAEAAVPSDVSSASEGEASAAFPEAASDRASSADGTVPLVSGPLAMAALSPSAGEDAAGVAFATLSSAAAPTLLAAAAPTTLAAAAVTPMSGYLFADASRRGFGKFSMDSNGVVTIWADADSSSVSSPYNGTVLCDMSSQRSAEWEAARQVATKIVFRSGTRISSLTGLAATYDYSAKGITSSMPELTSIDLTGTQTTGMTGLRYAFAAAPKLQTVIFPSDFDASRVTSCQGMFYQSGIASLDISMFNLASATDLSFMFFECRNLQHIDLPAAGLVRSSATNLASMFAWCENLKQDISLAGSDFSNVTSMHSTFLAAGFTSLDLGDMPGGTPRLTNFAVAFDGIDCTSLDLSGFDLSKVADVSLSFGHLTYCTTIKLPHGPTPALVDFSSAFYASSGLTSIDLTGWTFENVTDAHSAFEFCSSLQSISLPDAFTLAKCTSFSRMFYGCNELSTLDISMIDMMTPREGGAVSYASMLPSNLDEITLGPNALLTQTAGAEPNASQSVWASNGEGPWIRSSDSSVLSSAELRELYAAEGARPADTYRVYNGYAVRYDAAGAPQTFPEASVSSFSEVVPIPATAPQKEGTEFLYWDLGGARLRPGEQVTGESIKSNIMSARIGSEYATLARAVYADEPIENVTVEGRRITFDLVGGSTAHIANVPAGVKYQVEELTPDGWKVVDSSNLTGFVPSEGTASASVTNAYAPGGDSAEVTLFATKYVNWVVSEQTDRFRFDLYRWVSNDDPWEPVATDIPVGPGGVVSHTLSYGPEDAGQYYEYILVEHRGDDPDIEYSTDEAWYGVQVDRDSAGSLRATVDYGNDSLWPNEFNNVYKPDYTSLKVMKRVVGYTDPNQEFTFRLTFNDGSYANGSIHHADGSETSIRSNTGIFSLKANEYFYGEDWMPGTTYKVEELFTTGDWRLVSSSNAQGALAGENAKAEVEFVNESTKSAQVPIRAYKYLKGAALEPGAFAFDLYRVVPGENGSFAEELVETAESGAPDEATTVPDATGAPVANPYHGLAPVVFRDLEFLAGDIGTHEFAIRERVPDDAVNAAGVRYDAASAGERAAGGFSKDGVLYSVEEIRVTVTVSLDAQGNLVSDVAYAKDAGPYDSELAEAARPQTIGNAKLTEVVLRKQVEGWDSLSRTAKAGASFPVSLSFGDEPGVAASWPLTLSRYSAQGELLEERAVTADFIAGSITPGEWWKVSGLPSGAHYSLSEENPSGWTMLEDGSSAASGTVSSLPAASAGAVDATGVRAGRELTLENAYRAGGSVTPRAVKRMTGSPIKEGAYTFTLTDTTEGSGTRGSVIATATNGADGSIAFEPLEFTEADTGSAGSAVRTYEIREVAAVGDPYTTYDAHVVSMRVELADNGDGTISTAVTYDGVGDPYAFLNVFQVRLVNTGGPGQGLGYVGLAFVIGGLALAGVLSLRRRRK